MAAGYPERIKESYIILHAPGSIDQKTGTYTGYPGLCACFFRLFNIIFSDGFNIWSSSVS